MKSSFIPKVLLLCFCIGSLSGCSYFSPEQAVRTKLKEASKKAKQQFSNIKNAALTNSELSGTDDAGRPLWKVSAKSVHALGSSQNTNPGAMPANAQLTDAHAVLYTNGKPESKFDAPHIKLLYQDDGNVQLVLSGGVKVVTQGAWSSQRGPVHATTPQATVNIKKRQLWTNHGVIMEQGTGQNHITVTSKTLLANTSLKSADMSGDVTATTTRGVLTAPKANCNWQTGILLADGKVTAHNNDMTLNGQHLKADTQAHQVTVWGNATAKSAKGNASADTATYHWDNGVLNAEGNVHLTGNGATVAATTVQTTRDMQTTTASGGVQVQRGDVTVHASHATVTKTGNNSFSVNGDGSVKVQNPQGWASADHATWKNGQITANGDVTLSHAGDTLHGNSLQTDDKFKNATLNGNVHGSTPGGGSVSANKVIYANGKITATGGVSGEKGGLHLHANRMESSADGKLVLLKGNVTLRNANGTTVSAPQARYDRSKNQVYAWGGVTLHEAAHSLTQQGKTLTANLNLKQAMLTDVSGSGKINILQGKKLF